MDEEGGNDDIEDAHDEKRDHHHNCDWKTIKITIATEEENTNLCEVGCGILEEQIRKGSEGSFKVK